MIYILKLGLKLLRSDLNMEHAFDGCDSIKEYTSCYNK